MRSGHKKFLSWRNLTPQPENNNKKTKTRSVNHSWRTLQLIALHLQK